jgi:ketosteroid isomerase-like protein
MLMSNHRQLRKCAAVAAILVLGASVTACETVRVKKPSAAEDEAAIMEFNQRYLKAINDGDSATLASLTTPEHIMIAPGRPPLIGKEANDAANARAAQMFKIDEKWMPAETFISGDLAYQRGSFTVNATPKAGGGPVRKTSGNFLRIYKRQADGSWRMVRDMFNSDQPATPAPN